MFPFSIPFVWTGGSLSNRIGWSSAPEAAEAAWGLALSVEVCLNRKVLVKHPKNEPKNGPF